MLMSIQNEMPGYNEMNQYLNQQMSIRNRHRPKYMQEYLYSIRNHRYTATMLQHIAEDRDGTNH